jgi:anthrone oxygenase-like protein
VSVLAELFATLTAGLFAGAALYITVVEHPARLSCGPVIAVTEFRPSYKRAAVMQATLALAGAVAAIARWAMGSTLGWLIGGILLGAVIPFTLAVILPTNKRLLDPSLSLDSLEITLLLIRWGRLHAVRTGLSVVAFLMFLSLLVLR